MPRVHALLGVVGLTATIALLTGACSTGGNARPVPSGVPANRAGLLTVTRSHVVGAFPADTILAVAGFFDPPGPAPEATPGLGNCDFNTPTPSPTATTSTVPWRDAGATITLTTPSAQLPLDRYLQSDGSIVYVSDASADPAAFDPDAVFDLDFPGGSGANALPPTTVPGAASLPPSLGLAAPDFTAGAVVLDGSPLPVTWQGGTSAEPVEITLFISGSSGTATLHCTAPDDGSFELTGSQISA
ncbi:MAG TPA: hypothetical protein VMV18_12285, partial [bacterium]|nr:hypothetical protein [bacterium]